MVGQNTGAAGVVTFDLGNNGAVGVTGTAVTWNGTNAAGQRVASGSYTAQLIVNHNGAPVTVASTAITVLSTVSNLLGGAVAGPNPLYMTPGGPGGPGSGGTTIVIKLNSPPGVEVTARLYNLAGELITENRTGSSNKTLMLELGGKPVSSGVYILALSAQAPWGHSGAAQYEVCDHALTKGRTWILASM